MTEAKWHMVQKGEEDPNDPGSLGLHSDSRGNLFAYRDLLHETIAQLVTERKIIDEKGIPFGIDLYRVVCFIQESTAYNELVLSGESSPAAVSAVLDSLNFPRLPEVARENHQTTIIIGGPGCGKSTFLNKMLEQNEMVYSDAVFAPDELRFVLYASNGTDSHYSLEDHAGATQKELTVLGDRILQKLKDKLDQGAAPNVLMDISTFAGLRREVAEKSSKTTLYMMSAPVEICLERVLERTHKGMKRGVPTGKLIEKSKQASDALPSTFSMKNLEMRIYDTSRTKESGLTRIAEWDEKKRQLNVIHYEAFYDLCKRSFCNPLAKSEAELYANCPDEKQVIAHARKAYAAYGVALNIQLPGTAAFNQTAANYSTIRRNPGAPDFKQNLG
jgi:dephospho-CoA kinase